MYFNRRKFISKTKAFFKKDKCMCVLFLLLLSTIISAQESNQPIGAETLASWSSPYRGWTYYPDPVIPADYKISGSEGFHSYDSPCIYQLEGKPDVWYMSFIGYNGQGYNSFVAESIDLVHWTNPQLAMGFGPEGAFDNGGCVIGANLYDSWDVKAPRILKKKDGKYWTLYGCYPKQGGYELRPGYEGVATSDDGIRWKRAFDEPILSIFQSDCKTWEKDCIYQPWLLEHEGTYYNYYNAASGKVEQMGLALSNDLIHWVRYPFNPVLRNRQGGYDEQFCSDGKVFRDGDHWTMFYFGVGKGGASIMIAFSHDLLHWTADPEPLYKFGGHPTGLDKQYAHKISLVFNPKNETFYMYYCATGNKGRTIGLLTSKKLE
jgi:beta-xylosidase